MSGPVPSLGPFPTENDARAAIVAACLRMNALGINQGKAGNVSLRWHRGAADGMLITPSALDYEATTPDDVVWVSIACRDAEPGADPQPGVVDGVRKPSSEWRMHRDVYAARADAGAVIHTHGPYAATLACLPRIQREGIPAFHYMIALAGGDDLRCAAYATFGTQALSANAIAALQGRRACLLANHGLLAHHETLASALALAAEVESLCRMYWQALQVGEPMVLDADQMAQVHARFAGYR